MDFDYNLWIERHNLCVKTIQRYCDLDKKKDSIKCNSSLCVMNFAMQDIQAYFSNNKKSTAELCFLIRNIDVIITGILDIYNLLLGVGLNKQDKAIASCFTNKQIIHDFRTLRSLILAHPVDTHYYNECGEEETVYLEDVGPYRPFIDAFLVKEECDYVKRMCKPESNTSFYEPLSVKNDIVPVLNIIIESLKLLEDRVNSQITLVEKNLCSQELVLNRNTVEEYIVSLGEELASRYPSAVEIVKTNDGTVEKHSIIHDCLLYFAMHFKAETQEKYNLLLEYVKSELQKIELDLQNMEYDEDRYLSLLYDSDFAPGFSYECGKMQYLLRSEETSYTDDVIGNDASSDVLWGIRCFRKLMPFISEHIPVDTTSSDKGLYCQFVAANYLSNVKNT